MEIIQNVHVAVNGYLDDIDIETYKKNGSIPIECYECTTIFYLEK